jgi:predicted dehydrogenase
MRALIIGCGAAGAIHARELGGRGLELACYDADPARARAFAGQHGAEVVTDLKGADWDLAVVAIPPRDKAELGCDYLLEPLKPVVIEKPLALYPRECRRLVQAARAGCPLYIAESQAYGNQVEELADAIQSGEYGGCVAWRAAYATGYRPQVWSYDLGVGGGAFLEGGVHMLTVARVLFGEAIRWQGSVRGMMGRAPDTGTFLIDYEGGHQFSLSIAWGCESAFDGECQPAPGGSALIGRRRTTAWAPNDNHAAMWDHLLRCIIGEAEAVATIEHAAGAVGDVWACYEAAMIDMPDGGREE